MNTYFDEELIKKDGFWFEQIIEDHGFLRFFKEGIEVLSVKVEGTTFKRESVFKNYFTINENKQRIEIYFP